MAGHKRQVLIVVAGVVVLAVVLGITRPWQPAPGGAPLLPIANPQSPAATPAPPARPSPQATAAPNPIPALEEAVRLSPNDAGKARELGDAYLKVRQFARAADTFAVALASNQGNADLHAGLGKSLLFQGMTWMAVQEFKRALELEPAHGESRLNLGVAYTHSTPPDIAAAIAQWQEVLKTTSDGELAKKSRQFIDVYSAPATPLPTGSSPSGG